MRPLIHICRALAICFCVIGWAGAGSAQVAAFPEESGPLIPADIAPFQSRLDRLAREYGVKPIASGHAFGGFHSETFLFRLGEGSECAKQRTCVHVLFRDAQDSDPLVAFCDPGLFATAHNFTADGQPLVIFEFVCGQDTKFQIRLSAHSTRIESYITMEGR